MSTEERYTGRCPLHGDWISFEANVCPMPHPEPTGDPRFHALLKEIGDLHDAKQQDYGTDDDPFANIRASEEFGIPAWIGALSRMNDKVVRLKTFVRKGKLANEPAENSMMDIAVHVLIALVLYREEHDE